jgi:hypothetical protein
MTASGKGFGLLVVEIRLIDNKSSWEDKRATGRFLPHKLAVELARLASCILDHNDNSHTILAFE